MYLPAVQSGISATDYWSMSLEEIMIQIQANKNKKENDLKEKAMMDYTAQRLNIYALNAPNDFPSFDKAYPFFKKLEEAVQETKELTAEELKAQMLKDQEIMKANIAAIQATRERKQKLEER